ncbi:MAG: AAA family ATPase [Pseudomonadota bacterium]
MYESFYGLKVKPFQMVPDPAFMFWSETHQMAFTMLRYGILSMSPLTVITGEVGVGKTTLLRKLMNELSEDEMRVGLISNMQAGKGELLEWALMAFGMPFYGNHVECFHRLQQFIIDTYSDGRRVTLIIDEAQNVSVEQLEELRMLSNINAESDQLLQIILIGQPELRKMLARPELRQFVQRITSDFHMTTLNADETYAYIQHRLEVAGMEPGRMVFPRRICDLIYYTTGGVPRMVNVLSDLCLVYGYSADRPVIDEDLLRHLMSGIEKNGIFAQFRPLSGAPTLVRDAEPADETQDPDWSGERRDGGTVKRPPAP